MNQSIALAPEPAREATRLDSDDPAAGSTGLVEIVIPVYNEEQVLERSVQKLHAYLAQGLPYRFRITIADNASTDGTWQIATALERRLPRVHAVHLDLKGRGRALRHVWSRSEADVVSYMDVDLSTGLEAFLPLVAPLMSGHSDLAIGSRLHHGSMVVRGPKREFISRTYNMLLRTTMAARFSDAQCGFKAGRTDVVKALLAGVEDEAWFFDTELLLLAERSGLRVHEVPVDWVDDPDSRVDIVRTALDDLRGMARVTRRTLSGPAAVRLPPRGRPPITAGTVRGQLSSFAVIGICCTAAYLLLYLLLRQLLPAMAANALALLVTAVANTAANRRYTFGLTGSRDALRHQAEGGIAFVIGLVLSTGTLALTRLTDPHASELAELLGLIGANVLASAARFLLMKLWVFNPRRTNRQLHGTQVPSEEH